MNKPVAPRVHPRLRFFALLLVGVAGVAFAFRGAGGSTADGLAGSDPSGAVVASCAVALAPHSGEGSIDTLITQAQERARKGGASELEALGWLFVSKARLSYDPGFYALAEASAGCGLEIDPGSHGAMLLRGHALYSMHRFAEAGAIAERLTRERDVAFDFGLLGDVAVTQGRTQDAVDAYQRMVDLKPNLQSYSRAAHIRWLKGDVAGANELMRSAAGAASMRDPESLAWAWAQVAAFELQAGNPGAARAAARRALVAVPEHAPALLIRGRIELAAGEVDAAVASLERAAALNPLPEYRWALADALRLAGREDDAGRLDAALARRGALDDGRTTSLFLATRALAGRRGEQEMTPSFADRAEASPTGRFDDHAGSRQEAVTLARRELDKRADVYTRDAMAWALAAAGDIEGAADQMAGALSEGTEDARLFLHAGAIAARAGDTAGARAWLTRAAAIEHMLLPSEQGLLRQESDRLGEHAATPAGSGGPDGPRTERTH